MRCLHSSVRSAEESRRRDPLLQLENKYCTWSAKWTFEACGWTWGLGRQIQPFITGSVFLIWECSSARMLLPYIFFVPVWSPALMCSGAACAFHRVGCCDRVLGAVLSYWLLWPHCWAVTSEFFWELMCLCFLQLQPKVWWGRMSGKDIWLLSNLLCEGIVKC